MDADLPLDLPDTVPAVPEPSAGGSYTRDPDTNELTRTTFTREANDPNNQPAAQE